MTLGVVLVLISFGLSLIVVELFLIPGSSVVGFAGFGMSCVGVYGSFEVFGLFGGIVTLLITGGLSLAGLVIAIKKESWKMFALNNAIEEKVELQDQTELELGKEGVTISALRPGGTVSFDNKYFEVFSSSAFVDVKQKVKITGLKPNKIFVDRCEDQ
jgi:membrane-bound ClpP family serine protease